MRQSRRIPGERLDVRQHLRQVVLRDQLRRVARPGDRLRRRRLPAGSCAQRGRHPARSRPPQARYLEVRDPAQGAGPGPHPVRRLPGLHDRHADRAADREYRPAQLRLRQDQGRVPPEPCGLCLHPEVRPARPARRRSLLGARNRRARRGGRDREEVAAREARHRDPRLLRADRRTRAAAERLVPRRDQSVLLRRCRDHPDARGLHRPPAQRGRLGRRARQCRRHKGPAGPRRAGVRPPRCRACLRAHEHQRGQGC